MLSKPTWLVVSLVAVLTMARPMPGQEVSAEKVRRAIQRGCAYLKSQQNRIRGNWPEHAGQPGGLTALCTLALLTSGEDPRSPEIQAALTYLRNLGEVRRTYATSLQTMVFCLADPEKDRLLISRNARWLEATQIKDGPSSGMWGYGDAGNGDNSNTQFALLALYEAERVGVEIDPHVWQRSLDHFKTTQRKDGSWSYLEQQPSLPSSGSMTCAGVGSLLICADRLGTSEARVGNGGRVECCGTQQVDSHIEDGLLWLGQHGILRNPGSEGWHLYYLYGIERVGRLSGRRFLGRLDWYRTGAQYLVDQQDPLNGQWRGSAILETNPILATSFALLFLAKGRRPIVVSQLEWQDGSDWNRHPGAIHNLTRRVEERWKRDLAWQTIPLRISSVEDLMETPVLFIRGTEALNLSPQEKANLKEYVQQGGFLFVEACDGDGCDGAAFAKSFRDLAAELVPNSTLRELPPDHPVWYAEEKVDPKALPDGFWLYGIDACCRTSVVFANKTLSCYWELGSQRRLKTYPPEVAARVKAALDLGQNVLAYATNRELKERLDRPEFLDNQPAPTPARGALSIAKLSHGGGANDAPNALANLMAFFSRTVEVPVNLQRRLLAPTDLSIHDQPILFMHGRRTFRFSAAERQALVEYLQRGGFIFADAICASPQFAASVRREFEAMFPGSTFHVLPADHRLYSQDYRGFAIDRVTVRDPQSRVSGEPLNANLVQQSPLLEALEIDGRIAVILSPLDMSCALENQSSLECKGYIKTDAARLGTNILLFALGQ